MRTQIQTTQPTPKQICLTKIDKRFVNFFQKVHARRYLLYKLEGGEMPIAGGGLTKGEVKEIRRIVDEMVQGVSNA